MTYFVGSVREVEIIISIVVIFSLTETSEDEMESEGNPGHSYPNTEAVINKNSIDEEALDATVKEVEQPLLGSIGSVVDNLTSGV